MYYPSAYPDWITPTSYALTAAKDALKIKQSFCIAIHDDPAQEKDAMKIT